MLKLYVGAKIRLQETADGFMNRLGELREDRLGESGFASAEMIGLSVVGVLIAFAILKAFDKFIAGDAISSWLGDVLKNDGTK